MDISIRTYHYQAEILNVFTHKSIIASTINCVINSFLYLRKMSRNSYLIFHIKNAIGKRYCLSIFPNYKYNIVPIVQSLDFYIISWEYIFSTIKTSSRNAFGNQPQTFSHLVEITRTFFF